MVDLELKKRLKTEWLVLETIAGKTQQLEKSAIDKTNSLLKNPQPPVAKPFLIITESKMFFYSELPLVC